jgi:hypothetical protein
MNDRLPNPGPPNPTSHLRPFGRTIGRERPILELAPRGRWRAYARVVPVTGLSHPRTRQTGQTAFDVVIGWLGPPAGGYMRSPVPVDAQDSLLVWDGAELAQAVARIAHEIAGQADEIPFLEDLAAAIRADGTTDWRGVYYDRVGNSGRAAAEGF